MITYQRVNRDSVSDPQWDKMITSAASLFTTSLNTPTNKVVDPSDLKDELASEVSTGRSFLVLAKNELSGEYVGANSLVSDENNKEELEFALCYVQPESRQEGVLSNLVDESCGLAKESGFKRIIASPSIKDGSRKVFEEKGWKIIRDDEGQADFELDLKSYNPPEGNNPGFRA